MKLKRALFLVTLSIIGTVYMYTDTQGSKTNDFELETVSYTHYNNKNRVSVVVEEKLSVNKIDEILSTENVEEALEVLKSSDLRIGERIKFLENLASFDDYEVLLKAKKELFKMISEKDIATALRALPVTVHFDMPSAERKNLVRSICRFQKTNLHGFENLKLLLNRTKGFMSDEFKLNCERAV